MQYIISGKVIRGDGYGRKLGFPTLNVDRRKFMALAKKPAFGVYSGTATLAKKTYQAGIVIGPMDKTGRPKIEAHLIGFSGNAYGKTTTLTLNRFLRTFKTFKTEQALIAQITKDIARIQQ